MSAAKLGVLLGFAGAVVGRSTGNPGLLVMGLAAPVLMTHEVCRYGLFRAAQWKVVLGIDILWVGVSTAGVFTGLVSSPTRAVVVWVSGALAGVLAFVLSGASLTPTVLGLRSPAVSFDAGRPLRHWLASGGASIAIALQVMLWSVGGAFGPGMLGEIRTAQVFSTGYQLLGGAAFVTAVPVLTRLTAERDRVRAALRLSSRIAVGVALTAPLLYVLSDRIIALGFGDSMKGAEAFVLPMIIAGSMSAINSGFEALARVRGADRLVAASRLVASLVGGGTMALAIGTKDQGLAAWAWVGVYTVLLAVVGGRALITAIRRGVASEP